MLANIDSGYIEVEGGRVWYERVGTEKTGVPLVVLHGGPGTSHLPLHPLEELADERPVIFYDQLGCGKSDRPADDTLWTMERFVRELATLREALDLTNVHILGHSWGTMLLCDYLLEVPTGVVSAVFSSPCLSVSRWVADANRYRLDLPEDVQETLTRCERDGTTDSEAYRKAESEYMKRHVRRVDLPQELREQRLAAFGEHVYQFMWGPSEFYPTGILKTYERADELPQIHVPSLFTCGAYDEASPESTYFYHSLVKDSQYEVIEGSSHSPLVENRTAYLRMVRRFLASVERTAMS